MTRPAGTNPRAPAAKTIAALALVAFAWSGYEWWTLRTAGAPLMTPAAPRGIVSLQLAPSAPAASAILRDWSCQASPRRSCAVVTPAARAVLERDSRFIAAYVVLWLLVAVWARVAGGARVWVTSLVASGVILAGLFDLVENRLLLNALDEPAARTFTLARIAAMSKFVLILAGVAGAGALAGGGVRLFFGLRRLGDGQAASTATAAGVSGFADLMTAETRGIFEHQPNRPSDRPTCEVNRAADEPYVAFRQADIIGLALSGGGIRSATFNLGLLQGLHQLNLLRLFDYLSTVSGGGYIGSFWSAWLVRQTATPGTPPWDESLFPGAQAKGAAQSTRVETDQERHLREFSGFLAPRWGFFEVETWTAVVSLIAGLVPALLIGLSVIGLTLIAYLALTFPLASTRADAAPALVIGGITALVFHLFERMWREFKRETSGYTAAPTPGDTAAANHGRRRHLQFALITLAIVVALQALMPSLWAMHPEGPWPIFKRLFARDWWSAPDESGLVRWWSVTGIVNPGRPWIFSPRLFDYGLVWVATSMLLVMWRTTTAVTARPWRRETLAAFDRVLMRVLGMGVAWIGLTLLWHVAINLTSLITAAAAALVSGGIFAALRNWIGVALRRPTEAGATDRLRPYLPPVLAYLTLILTAVTVGGGLVELAHDDWFRWWQVAAVMTTLLVLALFISPEEFGLHAFYRDRIARAYSGATNLAPNAGAIDNRGTDPRTGDDPRFDALRSRPLHLVCCAANDLSGDQVATLGRGSRSAVLSKHGFSMGTHAREWHAHAPGSHLASGVTASAAAFNSNMGHISVRVGPAVSFLMTMMNLRLGLWVRHPLAFAAGFRRWPGLLYYREMLGLTSSSGRVEDADVPRSIMRDIHLSDGGHFENLALYELVRRHCRYIVLSDCGADPGVAFDDLGNALRRIREDFGVDIDLDVAPLRPDVTGVSRQHVAVGTIHYSTTDVGILLYVKPAVTGDEPPDVQQYRTRNTEFPHEATTDQFYDEAQWESYRRLGLHAAESIFHFVAREAGDRSADWVFAEASHRWGPTPEGLESKVLEMTKRFGAIEAEFQQRQAQGLLRHVFPELPYLPDAVKATYGVVRDELDGGAAAGAVVDRHQADPLEAETAMAAELALLLRVTQLMEDVWLACQLDRWWRHPLNLGWINLFARWATSPPFRFWWPMLAPMFSPGFRQFIQQRFPVRDDNNPAAIAEPQRGTIRRIEAPEGSGLAALWWERRSAQPVPWLAPAPTACRRVYFENLLAMPRDGRDVPMQVGLAALLVRGDSVGWSSDDFFVPPSLWGAGIGSSFLTNLLEEASQLASRCHVVVRAPAAGQDHQVARDDLQSFVEQYRKIGFREARPGHIAADVSDAIFCEDLRYRPGVDTLLTLDLRQWLPRRRKETTGRRDYGALEERSEK